MAGRTSPIFTDEGVVENPRVSSRQSSARSGSAVDDGCAEMEGYLLAKEEEIEALQHLSGHQARTQALLALTNQSCLT
eukprot:scaffold445181_cov43-Prasinocladus_malaysianus.AAC.1